MLDQPRFLGYGPADGPTTRLLLVATQIPVHLELVSPGVCRRLSEAFELRI